MKVYSTPVTESIDIRTADCFMATAGSGDHGQTSAPKRKKYIFF